MGQEPLATASRERWAVVPLGRVRRRSLYSPFTSPRSLAPRASIGTIAVVLALGFLAVAGPGPPVAAASDSAPASSVPGAVVGAAGSTGLLLGSSAVQPSADTDSAGLAEAFQYTAPASGTVQSLSLYVNSGNSAPAIAVGLYSDVSGQPATLLTSATINSPSAGAWNVVGVSPVAVNSGSVYWLAALALSGTLAIRDTASGGGPTENSASSSLSELPASWSSGAPWANSPASFYASASTAGSPPPPAPTNTAPPSISGSAVEGQTLSASNGSWTGSPTSYAYQWQDCNALGEGCLSVSGATASSYTLAASDVGDTVRVVVTAANAGGGTPAASATSGPVTARPLTASFTYSPTSVVSEQPVTFDAASSTCPDTPCTYEWSDDGSPTRPISPSWPLGSGQALTFTFFDPGTKYVRLVITDATGQTATVEHNVVVEASQSPPPPPAPTNTAPPSISGSAVEGQTLSASNGSWTGSPTSYAYQWQDCNALGEGCLSVSGATASSYTLAASDVGDTVRVVVTAANAGGGTPAASATSGPVTARPLTASFTYSPTSVVSEQPVTFDAASSTCPDTPCTYEWSDDGSPTRPISPSWPLGSGQALTFTFFDPGTKYVRLVITDATGQTATVEHNVVVEASQSPPPPPAPTNTAPPSISGSAVEGQTLSASNGSWTGSPTSYAYQWQDCNALGEGCLSVSGATASSYTLAASDVGGTVRVVVTASNSAGSALAPSAQTAMISKGGGQQTKCFPNPEACGYPGPNDTGPEAGVKLTEASGEVVLHNNEHYENKKLIGKIRVEGENDVIKNDEILTTGTCPTEECSSSSILQNSGNNLTIDHVRAGGTATHGANRANESITTFATNVTIEWSNIAYNSGGSTIDGGGTIAHDYCNMEFFKAGEHYECIDDDSLGGIGENEPPIIVKESTLYNPHSLTSVLFYKAEAAELKEVRIENNLLAGGGYTISIGPGGYKRKGPEIITGNRFARACEGKATKEGQSSKWFCASQTINYTEENASPSIDGDGYYPLVGAYGYWAGGEQSELKWSGNYFDENLEEATVGG